MKIVGEGSAAAGEADWMGAEARTDPCGAVYRAAYNASHVDGAAGGVAAGAVSPLLQAAQGAGSTRGMSPVFRRYVMSSVS